MNNLKKEELADIRAWTNTGKEAEEVMDILSREIFNHDISNIHLRHSALTAIHSHLKNYMLCMERDYYGPRSPEEIKLTDNLRITLEHVETVMSTYYNQEAAAMERQMKVKEIRTLVKEFTQSLDKNQRPDEWWGNDRDVWDGISKKFLNWCERNRKKIENVVQEQTQK